MFLEKMNDLFGMLDGSLTTSITDSTMMWIVHYAMDKAHGKVKSNGGAFQRLNEISKFYELAVIQLEGCMRFVQEEADGGILESCHEKVLADLTEIRDRLLGRLEESELAILEKDRELLDRFENELKLRQALELKERELVYLNDRFKLQTTDNEGVAELKCVSGTEDRDGEFCELMHSVDQQVLNIKQQLEPDCSSLLLDNEERNRGGVDNKKIEQMGFDIHVLKETMDHAFGKMQDAIFLSELRPQEKKWRWTIEKETVAASIKGFLMDFKENFEVEMRKQEKQVSMGCLSEHMSHLIKEAICLRNELESLIELNDTQPQATKGYEPYVSSSHSNLERGIPPRARSLSEGDSIDSSIIFSSKVDEVGQTQLHGDEPEQDSSHVAKMIKSHESIIRRKSEELNWLKREILRERGCSSSSRREKNHVSLKGRIQDVIVKLDNLIDCNSKLVETFVDDEQLHNEIRMLKQEKEDGNLLNTLMEETYATIYAGLISEFHTELHAYSLESLIKECAYEDFYKQMIIEWKEDVESNQIETETREEIYCIVCSETVNDFCSALNCALLNFQDEYTLREELSTVLFREMYEEWYANLQSYSTETLVREDISQIVFDEVIRDIVNAANYTLGQLQEANVPENLMYGSSFNTESCEIEEYSVREEVNMVFVRQVINEWKIEIDACNNESLIREEMHQFIIVETVKEACLSFMEAEAQKRDKSSENLLSADNALGSLEGGEDESLIQNLDIQNSALEEQNGNLDLVELEQTEVNEHEIFQESLNEDETTFPSVISEPEKAQERLAMSTMVLSELGSSLSTGFDDRERVRDQMTPTADIIHDGKSSFYQQNHNAEFYLNPSDSIFTAILEFPQVFENFEILAHQKLGNNLFRLDGVKHQLDSLDELVSSIQKRELLYKEAFIRRCQNLQKAETEVDLLGDQVDVLLRLLEKIYMTLHQHSPLLQQHFEVSELLKLIQEELTGERVHRFYRQQERSVKLYQHVLYTPSPPDFPRNPDKLSNTRNVFDHQKKESLPVIDEKDVVILSEKNFSHFVAKNRYVMVVFYAPWCYWSKKLVPEYAAAATELKGTEVVLAKVDADKEKALANKYEVQGYPSLDFFVGGVDLEHYYYNRNREALVNYAKNKMTLDVYTITTTQQAKDVLMAESTVVLGFLQSTESHRKELVAASKMHTDVIFYQSDSADVAKVFQIDPEIKRPTLVLIEKMSQQFSQFDGPFTKSAISEFVSINKLPLVITFGPKTTPWIFNSPLKQLWLYDLTHDANKVKSTFKEAAKAFKGKLLFVYVEVDWRNFGRQIQDNISVIGYHPQKAVAYRGNVINGNNYVMNGELNLTNIKSFAEKFMEDKLSS
ncbi:hypothetical protein ACOSP7_032828 [Xanthoceras sorbifolium]